MGLNILNFLICIFLFLEIGHSQNNIEIQVPVERPHFNYEVQDIEQTICWENDVRPECSSNIEGQSIRDDQQQVPSKSQSDQCISAHQSAVSKCKAGLNPESQNIVRAYANTLNQAQIAGNINQACEAAKQINILSGNANSAFVGLCRSAAVSCSSQCRKYFTKKSECDEFVIQSNQSNQQAILNAQFALKSQACVELTKANLKEVSKENFNGKNIEDLQRLAGATGNSLESNQVTPSNVDISKLRFTEKGYDFEGNAGMEPSKSVFDNPKNNGSNFNVDNSQGALNNRQANSLNEEKINDDFIREDKNIIAGNGYVNSDSYVIGNTGMPSDSNIDENNYNDGGLKRFVPNQKDRKPASNRNQPLENKNKSNQESFVDQVNRGLDQEIEITSEGNSAGKNSALVTITLRSVLFTLLFALIVYFSSKILEKKTK